MSSRKQQREVGDVVKPADPKDIEHLVGAQRQQFLHLARVINFEIFLLHSQACREISGINLLNCAYSIACDNTSPARQEIFPADETVVVSVTSDGNLIAVGEFQCPTCDLGVDEPGGGYLYDKTACGDPEHCSPVYWCPDCNSEGQRSDEI